MWFPRLLMMIRACNPNTTPITHVPQPSSMAPRPLAPQHPPSQPGGSVHPFKRHWPLPARPGNRVRGVLSGEGLAGAPHWAHAPGFVPPSGLASSDSRGLRYRLRGLSLPGECLSPSPPHPGQPLCCCFLPEGSSATFPGALLLLLELPEALPAPLLGAPSQDAVALTAASCLYSSPALRQPRCPHTL